MILLAKFGNLPTSLNRPACLSIPPAYDRQRDANQPLADRVVIDEQGLQRLLIIT
jgi:hypothetical protein